MTSSRKAHHGADEQPCGCGASRRSVLAGAVALGVTGSLASRGFAATEDPKKLRPQPGDVMVYAHGDNAGQIIAPEALPLGGPQEMAYPMEPGSKTVRDGSRLNQIALVRFDPADYDDETKQFTAEGVAAYTAICTHQACPVSMWEDDNGFLFCSCHASQFNPRKKGEKVEGPAPRRLPILPIAVENGTIVAAGEFVGHVGIKR